MRRSVAVNEPNEFADETFSALLEQMTRRHQTDANVIHPDQENFSVSKSAIAASRRQRLQPLPEPKARMAEAASLSYEQALKRHSRRHVPLELPDEPALQPDALLQKASAGTASKAADKSAPPTRVAARRKKAVTANPRPSSSRPSPVVAISPGSSTPKKPTRKKHNNPPVTRAAATTVNRATSSEPSSNVQLHVRSKRQAKVSPCPLPPKAVNQAITPTTSRAITPVIPAGIDLFEQPEADQRRTILSVRLSEEELARLRQRAAESGISVSAYMRSCVLDADHLRAQVKQALSEMRSSLHRPEPVSAMQLPAQAGTAFGNTWFRVLTRTAALLLGPLVSLRHRV